jgi:NADPH2:quinone reductase
MADRIIEANGGERVDIVLEMSGGEVFEQSRKALAHFGRLVTYGIASGDQNEVRTGSLMRRSHAVVGFWLAHLFGRPGMFEEALTDLFARAADGSVRVVTGPTYALSDAKQAQIDLAGRKTSGKVTLDVTK